MPFKSRAQRRFMFAAEARGEVPEGTARRWQRETGDKKLPERKMEKSAAFEAGVRMALEKDAALPFSSAAAVAKRGAEMGLKGAKPMGLIGGGTQRLRQRAASALAAAKQARGVTATYGTRV